MSLPFLELSDGSWLVPFTFELEYPCDDDELDAYENLEGTFTCLADGLEPFIDEKGCQQWPNHYAFAINDQGSGFFFLEEHDALPYEVALREGIAPGQVFYVRLSVECYGGGGYYSYYTDDYDEAWSYEIVWRESLSAFEHERRWERWFYAWAKEKQKDVDAEIAWKARCADESLWFVSLDDNHLRGASKILLCSSARHPVASNHRWAPTHYPRIDTVALPTFVLAWDDFFAALTDCGWDKYPLAINSASVDTLVCSLGVSNHWRAEDYCSLYNSAERGSAYKMLAPLRELRAAIAVKDAEIRLAATEDDEDDDDY